MKSFGRRQAYESPRRKNPWATGAAIWDFVDLAGLAEALDGVVGAIAWVRSNRHALIMADPTPLPGFARVLGCAGLLPQLAALVLLASGPIEHRHLAQLLAIIYASLIFSFLGALWWGLAAAQVTRAPTWIWSAGVLPSLVSLLVFLLWASGHLGMPGALSILALGIAGSALVDRRLNELELSPPGWTNLRFVLSFGLVSLTAACDIA